MVFYKKLIKIKSSKKMLSVMKAEGQSRSLSDIIDITDI